MSTFEGAKKAYEKALEEDRPSSEIAVLIRECFEAASTVYEINLVCDEFDPMSPNNVISFEEYADKIILLAETVDDVWWDGVVEADPGSEREGRAFDKILSLCKDKEDVEAIMERIFSWNASLDFERFFVEIFKRGRELPEREREPEEDR